MDTLNAEATDTHARAAEADAAMINGHRTNLPTSVMMKVAAEADAAMINGHNRVLL